MSIQTPETGASRSPLIKQGALFRGDGGPCVQEVIATNAQLSVAVQDMFLDDGVERRPLVVGVRQRIEDAIEGSARAHGNPDVTAYERAELLYQVHDLYQDTVRLARVFGMDSGDYYSPAITIAGMYGNSADVDTALQAVDVFMTRRLEAPGTFLVYPSSGELRRGLVRLCGVDTSHRSAHRLYRSYMQESMFKLMMAGGVAGDTPGKLWALPQTEESLAIDPALALGETVELLTELAIHAKAPWLGKQIMRVAKQEGVDVDGVEEIITSRVKRQGPNSAGEQQLLTLLTAVRGGAVDVPSGSLRAARSAVA